MLPSFGPSAELIANPEKPSDSISQIDRCPSKTAEESGGKDFLQTLNECIGKTASSTSGGREPSAGNDTTDAQVDKEEISGADVFPEEAMSAAGLAWTDSPAGAIEQIGVSLNYSNDTTDDANVTKTEANAVPQPVVKPSPDVKAESFSLGIRISEREIETTETGGQDDSRTAAEAIRPQGRPTGQQVPASLAPGKTGTIQESQTVNLSGEQVTGSETEPADQEPPTVNKNTRESIPHGATLSRASTDAGVSEPMETSRSTRSEPPTAGRPITDTDTDPDESLATQPTRVVQTAGISGEGDVNSEPNGSALKASGGSQDTINTAQDASAADSVSFNGSNGSGSKIERFQTDSQGQSIETPLQKIESGSIHEMVEKAVWSVRNGQSEVRIALKPEHLGHVRMLIVTEAEQVSVRIFTDAAMTKDLIESHMQQLKNELEQQGLRVEKMDVLVAGEEHQPGSDRYARERTGQQLFRRPGQSNSGEEQTGGEQPETDDSPRPNNRSEGIDYFA